LKSTRRQQPTGACFCARTTQKSAFAFDAIVPFTAKFINLMDLIAGYWCKYHSLLESMPPQDESQRGSPLLRADPR
jgi:hypothetical protein